MVQKKIFQSRILDFILVALLVIMVVVPSVRLQVMSTAQKVLLRTGLFNASPSSEQSELTFSYNHSMKDTLGHVVDMERMRTKVLFINLWATWCPPCIAEMPEIAKLYQSVGEEIEFIMISVDADQQKAKEWIKNNSFPVPVYFPSQLNSSLSYQSIPTTLVVDRTGKIVFRHEGLAQYNTESFKEFLLSL